MALIAAIGSPDGMEETVNTLATPSIEAFDILRAAIMNYAGSQSPEICEQYLLGLVAILSDLRANGFGTAELEQRIITALRNKDSGGYVNHACELAATGYFLQSFPDGFRYQVDSSVPVFGIGPAKNFDFSFVADERTFNVEVKAFAVKECPSDEYPPPKAFLTKADREALYGLGMRFSKNCAPAIARFLTDANTQLVQPEKGLSVVLLCCNDLDEYTDALTCFIGPHGICGQTEKEGLVPAPADLPNIDAVVICLLGFNHLAVVDPARFKQFYKDESVGIADGADAWDYVNAFPVGIYLRPGTQPIDPLDTFMKAFHSYNLNIFELMQQNGGDIQCAVFELFNRANNPRLVLASGPSSTTR